jgi:hypothetical protein
MKHAHRLALLDHVLNPRFIQRRYRCEWCDLTVAPEEVLCEACARAELDKQLEEEGDA